MVAAASVVAGGGRGCPPRQQVEEVLDPSLRGKPVGIRQKYLMVTCNYAARRIGARKMESVIEVSKGWLLPETAVPPVIPATLCSELVGRYRSTASLLMLTTAPRWGASHQPRMAPAAGSS